MTSKHGYSMDSKQNDNGSYDAVILIDGAKTDLYLNNADCKQIVDLYRRTCDTYGIQDIPIKGPCKKCFDDATGE